jgi:hypothetical protein
MYSSAALFHQYIGPLSLSLSLSLSLTPYKHMNFVSPKTSTAKEGWNFVSYRQKGKKQNTEVCSLWTAVSRILLPLSIAERTRKKTAARRTVNYQIQSNFEDATFHPTYTTM